MNLQEAYQEDLEKIAAGIKSNKLDVEKVTALLKTPNSAALRMFLAIGAQHSPAAVWMAEQIWNNEFPLHTCYHNDRFAIAYHFDLDAYRKKESTLNLLKNAMAGYFEARTHSGFRLSDLLCSLGAMDDPITTEEYVALREDKVRKIAHKLGINELELAHCAEEVCNWGLVEGYHVEGKSSFHASTPLEFGQIERLADTYIPRDRFENEFRTKFERARKNIQAREYSCMATRKVTV